MLLDNTGPKMMPWGTRTFWNRHPSHQKILVDVVQQSCLKPYTIGVTWSRFNRKIELRSFFFISPRARPWPNHVIDDVLINLDANDFLCCFLMDGAYNFRFPAISYGDVMNESMQISHSTSRIIINVSQKEKRYVTIQLLLLLLCYQIDVEIMDTQLGTILLELALSNSHSIVRPWNLKSRLYGSCTRTNSFVRKYELQLVW